MPKVAAVHPPYGEKFTEAVTALEDEKASSFSAVKKYIVADKVEAKSVATKKASKPAAKKPAAKKPAAKKAKKPAAKNAPVRRHFHKYGPF